MMKKWIAMTLAGALALSLAACGGATSSSSEAASAAGSEAASEAASVSTPASTAESTSGEGVVGGDPAEHTVEAIQAKGTLVVTTEAGYAPFEFLDDEGNVVGWTPASRRRWRTIWASSWTSRTSLLTWWWPRCRPATRIWPSRA